MTERAMGVTRACGLVGISRSLFHYESRRRIDDEALTGRMMAIAAQKRRYDHRRIHVQLQRDGYFANHKRIWRLYIKAGLSMRKRIAVAERTPRPLPTDPNQSWSMDFVSDGLAYGRRFRCLNVVDDYTRVWWGLASITPPYSIFSSATPRPPLWQPQARKPSPTAPSSSHRALART